MLLDLDGTLVDTVGLRVASWLEAFAAEDIALTAEELGPWMGADGRWLAVQVAANHGRVIDDATADRLDRVSGELFGARNVAPAPIAGARELLETLTELGTPWIVATSSRPEQATASLSALRLRGSPLLVDASHVEHAKPEPDLLLAGATQLGVPPTDAWYIGDSRWDMLAAVAADMTAIGVTTGATGADALRVAGAGHVVESLLHVVDRLHDLVGDRSRPGGRP